VIDTAIAELAPVVVPPQRVRRWDDLGPATTATIATARRLGVTRSGQPGPNRRRLSAVERKEVPRVLHEPGHVDEAPATVYAKLLDAGP
jgi:hypothetical protein